MALFKILKGDSSRISTDKTQFHDGWAYFTPDDGGFYIDASHDGKNDRIRVNPTEAETAKTLKEARTIDGVSFDGSENIVHYGTCSTTYSTAAKVVDLPGFVLETGAEINVKFTYYNTASSPTLNVNGTGAKAIKQYSSTAPQTYMWYSNSIVHFVYDGTYWQMDIPPIAGTTYYGVTKLSSSTSSTSTSLAATASAVKSAYDLADAAVPKTTVGAANGVAGLDANGKILLDQLPEQSTSVDVTLTSNGWSNGTQSVSVSGMTSIKNGVVGVSNGATDDQINAANSAKLSVTAQANGSITIRASGTTPTVNIPITVIMFE